MPKFKGPRKGSLQFYPRVRAKRILPRVNWDAISKSSTKKDAGLMGFIGYKVGMMSAYIKDNTANSLTKSQRIIIPVTIVECPSARIFSVRFYKDGKVIGEVLNKILDKELKRKLKLPKNPKATIEEMEKKGFDDVRAIVYSQVKKTGIKKAPDILEIGLSGSVAEKLGWIKNNMARDISIKDIIKEGTVDIHGVTIGKGLQGTIKRFGLTLKAHKSEKGQRTLGSGGPWHPSRVDFHQPRAGQMGFFTRVTYNNKIVNLGSVSEKDINPDYGFKHYGKIKTDYLILRGSIQGPAKRAMVIALPVRPSKPTVKLNYEFIELR
jgi:large subunit ribosomal protein L3